MSETTIGEMPFRHDSLCACFGCAKDCVSCTCQPEIPAKASPESEDKAFERAWLIDDQTDSSLRHVAQKWWNARARLDAKRGKQMNIAREELSCLRFIAKTAKQFVDATERDSLLPNIFDKNRKSYQALIDSIRTFESRVNRERD